MICNCACRCVLNILTVALLVVGGCVMAVGAILVWGKDVVQSILHKFIEPLMARLNVSLDDGKVSTIITRILTSSSPIGLAIFSIGAAIVILAVIGLIGSCCDYKILLTLFAIINGILALGLLIVIIVFYANKSLFGEIAVKLYKEHVVDYVSMKTNNIDSLIVGLVQPALNCCGVYNSTDFVNASPDDEYDDKEYFGISNPIPCCKMNAEYKIIDNTCPATFNDNNSNINHGCADPLRTEFLKFIEYAMYGIIVAFLFLLGVAVFTGITICVDVI